MVSPIFAFKRNHNKIVLKSSTREHSTATGNVKTSNKATELKQLDDDFALRYNYWKSYKLRRYQGASLKGS